MSADAARIVSESAERATVEEAVATIESASQWASVIAMVGLNPDNPEQIAVDAVEVPGRPGLPRAAVAFGLRSIADRIEAGLT